MCISLIIHVCTLTSTLSQSLLSVSPTLSTRGRKKVQKILDYRNNLNKHPPAVNLFLATLASQTQTERAALTLVHIKIIHAQILMKLLI